MARLTFSLAAAAASLVSSVSAAATTGDFNVLTMNVAGLPAILNGNDVPGDKTTNSLLIGTLLAKYDYDIIHVQEGQLKLKISYCTITDCVRLQLPCFYLCQR